MVLEQFLYSPEAYRVLASISPAARSVCGDSAVVSPLARSVRGVLASISPLARSLCGDSAVFSPLARSVRGEGARADRS